MRHDTTLTKYIKKKKKKSKKIDNIQNFHCSWQYKKLKVNDCANLDYAMLSLETVSELQIYL